MMVFTHLMVSLLLYEWFPVAGAGIPVLTALITGSLFPDLDMKRRHRRDLHYPVIYPVLTAFSFLAGNAVAKAFFLAASAHCLMDILGNDVDVYTGEGREDSEKGAVFNHLTQKWIDGRYLVKIDGGARDLGMLASLVLLHLLYAEPPLVYLGPAAFALGAVYNLIREDVERIFPDILLR
ncbi:MAG: hypothetical protein ABEJ07_03565 [Candidatus Nanohaloarchaea archaeon]